MTQRVARAVLLVSLLVSGVTHAQAPSLQDRQVLDSGIPVRDAAKLSVTEKLGIVFERALLPRKKIVEPLYAYGSSNVCDPNVRVEDWKGHTGTAAIVVVSAEAETDIALYRPTVADAIVDARANWCGANRNWYFATTYPLSWNETARYVSRDVDRIVEELRTFQLEVGENGEGRGKSSKNLPPKD